MLPQNNGEVKDATPKKAVNARDRAHSLEGYPPGDRKAKAPAEEARVKVNRLLAACAEGQDPSILVALATSAGGLIDDEVRRKAWPILLGYKPCVKGGAQADVQISSGNSTRHKDEDQVDLDVNRSFVYYPKGESDSKVIQRRKQLLALITHVLRRYPMLSYFQGFHDIVQVILLVLGYDQAEEAVLHLSLLRLRDFMLPSLSPSLMHLRLLPSILSAADPQLCKHLSQTEPYFALGATLTLYAHEIQEYGDIARLFDFFLAHGAVVSIYFFAVIVMSRRKELFEIPADEPEMLHSVLSKLPEPLDLEALVSSTMALIIEHPPEQLPSRAWAKISSYSVLKTAVGPTRQQTLQDGEKLFTNQLAQLERAELRQQAMTLAWKHRQIVGSVGLAVAVGLLSFWLRRNGL